MLRVRTRVLHFHCHHLNVNLQREAWINTQLVTKRKVRSISEIERNVYKSSLHEPISSLLLKQLKLSVIKTLISKFAFNFFFHPLRNISLSIQHKKSNKQTSFYPIHSFDSNNKIDASLKILHTFLQKKRIPLCENYRTGLISLFADTQLLSLAQLYIYNMRTRHCLPIQQRGGFVYRTTRVSQGASLSTEDLRTSSCWPRGLKITRARHD